MKNTLDIIRKQIKLYNGFPKEGIVFIDLLPLLANAETFSSLIKEIDSFIQCPNVAAPEARGFLFATPLLALNGGVRSMIAFRKGGKLPAIPGDIVKIPVMKEYGDDSLYFRKSDLSSAVPSPGQDPSVEITIFDDVLATGGTAEGMALNLNEVTVETSHGVLPVRVKQFVFLAEIEDIGARTRLEKIAPVVSLLKF